MSFDRRSVFSCEITEAEKPEETKVTSVSINGTSQITATGTATLEATAVFTGTEPAYTWSITGGSGYATLSATAGKTVTLTGKNTTSAAQDVTVKVTAGDKEATHKVKVLKTGETVKDEVTSVKISASADSISATETTTLEATAVFTGTEPAYTWSITGGSSHATLSPTAGKTVTLTGKNTTNAAQNVTVKVVAGDKKTTKTITVAAASSTKNVIRASNTPTGWAGYAGTKDLSDATVTPPSNYGGYGASSSKIYTVSTSRALNRRCQEQLLKSSI